MEIAISKMKAIAREHIESLGEHPTKTQIEDSLKNSNPLVKIYFASFKLTEEQVERGLRDADPLVRMAFISSPNILNPSQLLVGNVINDVNPIVRKAAETRYAELIYAPTENPISQEIPKFNKSYSECRPNVKN